jgi:2-C-methyl-D-erythritol 4-phosphate cytidylyltransferase/2-C-methyl-D-erythritol 2,4-cyclodiphosphate synthase
MRVSAIIAAGGRGSRFGGGELKQLRLAAGRATLDRSVSAFVAHPSIAEVIVALPEALAADPPSYLRTPSVRVVAGGERRQDSVAEAFRASNPSSDIIVIHDAARPFVTSDLIARTVAAAVETGAAVAAVQARETVKLATGDPLRQDSRERGRYVQRTLPRETVFLAQTPQAFRRSILAAALEAGERESMVATDEACLAERAGYPVRLVTGEPSNIKITTPDDMTLAEVIAREPHAAGRPARTGRAGTGYDLHRLVEGRPLLVCGVKVPSSRGALGHSDADVGCHAIVDAMFGALGLGDIGRHFPDADERWRDASSLDLLARTAAMVAEQGYEVGNVDVTIVLEAPKLRDHVDAMRRAIAAAIGIDVARVSVKAKTNEGMDAIGRGDAIAAHAVALVRSAGRT